MCDRWDSVFPRASLKARPAVGSDHVPLVVDAGLNSPLTSSHSQFDASWLLVEGFNDLLASKIAAFCNTTRRSFGPMDDWHKCAYELRKFLRGWSCNRAADLHKEKDDIESQLRALDSSADQFGLSASQWSVR